VKGSLWIDLQRREKLALRGIVGRRGYTNKPRLSLLLLVCTGKQLPMCIIAVILISCFKFERREPKRKVVKTSYTPTEIQWVPVLDSDATYKNVDKK
jgi:hypothetical protein